jgi:hypothetical protein
MAKLDYAPNNFLGVLTTLDVEAHAICKAWLTPTLETISPTRSPTRPSIPITRPDFDYTPARATNVVETWRKHGWKAPLKRLCP